MSVVTVPSFGLGINPFGPKTFPCFPILLIIASVLQLARQLVHLRLERRPGLLQELQHSPAAAGAEVRLERRATAEVDQAGQRVHEFGAEQRRELVLLRQRQQHLQESE